MRMMQKVLLLLFYLSRHHRRRERERAIESAGLLILGDVMDPIVAASVKRSEQRGVKIINFIYILI